MSDALTYGGLVVQLIALVLLLRGPFSRYFPLFLYLLSIIGVTASLTWLLRTQGVRGSLYYNVYWGGELLMDILLFFLVISLTMRALEGSPIRDKVVRLLGFIVIAAIGIPFLLFDSAVFGRHWNESVSQLLNFGAAVMNLALWSALVISKQRDRQLLTVSAGLGIMVAAAALMLGVRRFTNQDDSLRVISDTLYRISQTAGPLIWCWAFRPARKQIAPPLTATPSAS